MGNAEISNCRENRLLFWGFAAKFHALGLQQPDQRTIARLRVVGDELVAVAPLALDDFALQGDRVDAVTLHLSEECGVIDGRRLPGAHAKLAENRQQNDRQGNP